jgi:hypothetical protein
MVPGASVVYKIKITKNGEQNTLFGLSDRGMEGRITYDADFAAEVAMHGPCPNFSHSSILHPSCKIVKGAQRASKAWAAIIWSAVLFCAKQLNNTPKQLSDLHVSCHSLHGSFAAYAEALEWHTVPHHQLGRWAIPSAQPIVIGAAAQSGRGAGSMGPKTIAARYSTAASAQIQYYLRDRMMEALQLISARLPTHGDLSPFIRDAELIRLGFRGPEGHQGVP